MGRALWLRLMLSPFRGPRINYAQVSAGNVANTCYVMTFGGCRAGQDVGVYVGVGGVALCHQRRVVGQLFDLIQQTVGRQWGFVCSSCTATEKERDSKKEREREGKSPCASER